MYQLCCAEQEKQHCDTTKCWRQILLQHALPSTNASLTERTVVCSIHAALRLSHYALAHDVLVVAIETVPGRCCFTDRHLSAP